MEYLLHALFIILVGVRLIVAIYVAIYDTFYKDIRKSDEIPVRMSQDHSYRLHIINKYDNTTPSIKKIKKYVNKMNITYHHQDGILMDKVYFYKHKYVLFDTQSTNFPIFQDRLNLLYNELSSLREVSSLQEVSSLREATSIPDELLFYPIVRLSPNEDSGDSRDNEFLIIPLSRYCWRNDRNSNVDYTFDILINYKVSVRISNGQLVYNLYQYYDIHPIFSSLDQFLLSTRNYIQKNYIVHEMYISYAGWFNNDDYAQIFGWRKLFGYYCIPTARLYKVLSEKHVRREYPVTINLPIAGTKIKYVESACNSFVPLPEPFNFLK